MLRPADVPMHRNSSADGWRWLVFALVAWLLAAPALVFLAQLVGDDHRLELTILQPMWGVAGAAALLLAGRVTFGRWLSVGLFAIGWLAGGLLIASLIEFTLIGWGSVRFGQQGADPELLGVTRWLALLVVAATVTGFATVIAPPGAARPPFIALILSAGIALLVVASNVPGAANGIQPESWPLAVAIGLVGAYVVTLVMVAMRSFRQT